MMWVRVRELLDWRFLLSAAFLALVVTASLNSWAVEKHNRALMAQLDHDRAAAVVERSEASRERQRILDGQNELQERHERLLDYLRSQGIDVPESIYRTSSTRVDGDDDDGGDTNNITVRPETSNDQSESGRSSSPSPSPSASTSENNVTDVVPEIPLPAPAGEATDTAKRIIEDVTGIVTE